MDTIIKYYNDSMPSQIVPRLSSSEFSSCGYLTSPKFKTQNTIVFFYVPECRFCQEFSGELTKFALQYSDKTGTGVAAIDMSLENNYPLVKSSNNFPYKLGDMWPMIIVFYKGKPCSSYSGPRNASALNDFIVKNIGVGKSCSFKFVPCD